MNILSSQRKLAQLCTLFGVLLIILSLFRVFHLIYLDESTVAWMKMMNIDKAIGLSTSLSVLALAYFFLFLSQVIRENFQDEVSLQKNRFCKLTMFFLGTRAGFDFFKTVKTGLITLNMTSGDIEFFSQMTLTIAIELIINLIPAVLALVLYRLSKDYNRLLVFEKEVI